MSNVWTADGWCGQGSTPWTADGWPFAGEPWTADGAVQDHLVAVGAAHAASVATGRLSTQTRFAGGAISQSHMRVVKRHKRGNLVITAPSTLTTDPAPPPLPPQPAEDVDLDAILQQTVRDICALEGDLVRPRWQPIMPKQPESTADWAAIGVTNIIADDGPAIVHNPLGQGTDTYYRHEELDALVSFYGPHSQQYAARFRDGIALPQNTEALGNVDIRWVECGSILQVPDLVNTKWIRRQDMTLRFRRKVTRVYGIESLLIADVNVFDDTTVDFTVIVPPNSHLEP